MIIDSHCHLEYSHLYDQLDQVVRVTGDSILCDEVMLEKAIENQITEGSDVNFINNMP